MILDAIIREDFTKSSQARTHNSELDAPPLELSQHEIADELSNRAVAEHDSSLPIDKNTRTSTSERSLDFVKRLGYEHAFDFALNRRALISRLDSASASPTHACMWHVPTLDLVCVRLDRRLRPRFRRYEPFERSLRSACSCENFRCALPLPARYPASASRLRPRAACSSFYFAAL